MPIKSGGSGLVEVEGGMFMWPVCNKNYYFKLKLLIIIFAFIGDLKGRWRGWHVVPTLLASSAGRTLYGLRLRGPLAAFCVAMPLLVPMHALAAHYGELSLDERVACQTTLEDIAWSETLWPDVNPTPKPAREVVLSDAQIRARVEEHLRMESVLAADFGQHITSEMLQIELNRMAANTKAPDRLQHRFAALGDDAELIVECIVRPRIVSKYLRSAYGWDERLHGDLRKRAEEALSAIDDPIALSVSGADERVFSILRRDGPDAAHELESAKEDEPLELVLDPEAFAAEAGRFDLLAGVPEIPLGIDRPMRQLRETEQGYVFEKVLARAENRIDLRSLQWFKRPFEEWWSDRQRSVAVLIRPSTRIDLMLPVISRQVPDLAGEPGDAWRLEAVPAMRSRHTAVWTGSEMIIWGGSNSSYLDTGSRYEPATDSWSATSTAGAPAARNLHTAVWTGTEMIVWGGWNGSGLATGGRYDPASDSWTATGATGVPVDARALHTAVWTGSEMIVWGGYGVGYIGTGARYDPAGDDWTPTAMTGAPDARSNHTAVWTGASMIVWGGWNGTYFSTGSRYDPSTDVWSAVAATGAPEARTYHTATWTGAVMVVWGGWNGVSDFSTGGRYDPIGNVWLPTSSLSAPSTRSLHTAVWTGSEMIVWGGADQSFNYRSGGRYDPVSDSWTATALAGSPSWRTWHTAVWTGSEMIIWGGVFDSSLDTGGRYNASTDNWMVTADDSGPSKERAYHTAVWTGNEMLVWGGWLFDGTRYNDGGRYSPVTDAWSILAMVNAPAARAFHTAVWTGEEMIVWGGSLVDGSITNTGGRYRPVSDSWAAVSPIASPAARRLHTVVWTGVEMIIWGGQGDSTGPYFATGARYAPASDNWTATTTSNAPIARVEHTAVWTGSEMIVWGGWGGSNSATGGRYDPANDSWTPTATGGAPVSRSVHTAVWTGDEMIVWGGDGAGGTGGRYDPVGNGWVATSSASAPVSRFRHTAVWTGNEMVVWGGNGIAQPAFLASGGRYDLASDSWSGTTMRGAPGAREGHTAIWTGDEMIVWGRYGLAVYYPSGPGGGDVIFASGFEPSQALAGAGSAGTAGFLQRH